MSLRHIDDQIAYEHWTFALADACDAAGVQFPCDPAMRWYRGEKAEDIVAEMRIGRAA